MKLILIFLTCFNLAAVASGFSQTVSIHVTSESLAKVFSRIEKQTGYVFFYDGKLLRDAKPVTINVEKELEPALKEIFADQPLTYSIKEKAINVFRKAPAPKTEVTIGSPVQQTELAVIDVHGKVTDENGKPAAGVSVRVKGTNKGTTTNDTGDFSLAGVDNNATLVFSSVNMETFEIPVSGRSDLLIKLKNKTTELGEVIIGSVNTGYQTVSKERSVGSFSKVDSALYSREVSTDLLSRLNGITNSLLFDNHTTNTQHLQIRGISTIQSNPEPLIILDNFPYTGNINNINPNDVLDITVLRDAAAASVWGAKAGNGVIVVTTKKGKYNQPIRISANSNITVIEKPNPYYFPQMSSSDFIDVEKVLFAKGAYISALNNTSTRPIISPVIEILNKQKNGLISQSEASSMIDAFRQLDVRKDYEKYIFRDGVNRQNYINISGGGNAIAYNLSTGLDHNLATYQGSNSYNRYSLNATTSFKPYRSIEIVSSLLFSQTDQISGTVSYPFNPQGGKAQIYPYAQFADANGNAVAVAYKYRLGYIDTVGGGKLLDWHYRPLDELKNTSNSTKTQNILLNLGMRWNLLPWLNAEIKYQYGSQMNGQEVLYSQNSFYARDMYNAFTNFNSTVSSLRNPVPVGGIKDVNNSSQTTQNFRGQLNITKEWQDRHELTGLVAAEVSEIKTKNAGNRIYGYDQNTQNFYSQVDYSNYYPLFIGGSTMQIINNLSYGSGINRSLSVLANVFYRYKKRYILYGSARKDGSNFFGVETNNRWKPLWSLGAGWDIAREPFYHLSALPTLKFRASYGYTGNINNSIPAVTLINYSGSNDFTGTPSAFLSYAANPGLRWEQVGILNVALDFGFLDNKITGSLEWFRKKSTDAIANSFVDPSFGLNLNQTTLNSASLSAKGVDLHLFSQNIAGRLFSWNTSLNYSYAKTIVTDYFQNPVRGIPTSGDINPAKGQMAWALYAYKWAGLDPITGDPMGYLANQVSKNYTGIMNDSFQNHIMVGSSLPLHLGNMLNTFSFKGFSISANIIFKFSYYFRRPTLNYTNLFNSWIGNIDYINRWQLPGDEKRTTVPSLVYPGNANRDAFYANSEVNVEKGDNVRLNDIRVSYSFNSKATKNKYFKSLQVFGYASNLNLFIWKATKTTYNPDFPTSIIPPTKNYSVGVNLSF